MPFSAIKFQEAEAALNSSSEYRTSKSERNLNAIGAPWQSPRFRRRYILNKDNSIIGDKVVETSENFSMATTARGDRGDTNAILSLIKDNASHFAENSRILVDVLDNIAKIHPFIQGMFYDAPKTLT
jgi:hypothetical protein